MPDRLTCEQTFRRLNDYLDRELSPDVIQLIEEHLASCLVCAREYAFEGTVLREVGDKLRRSALPEDVRDRLLRSLAAVSQDA